MLPDHIFLKYTKSKNSQKIVHLNNKEGKQRAWVIEP